MANPAPHISTNHKQFFDKLAAKAKRIAEEKAEKRAENILNGLRFRRRLLGEGGARYPRWDGYVSPYRTDGHSFKDWRMVKKGPAHYVITNSHVNSVDGYNYVRDIFYGVRKGSDHQWALANHPTKNLVFTGSKIFSRQLPRGLVPYVMRQDKLFMEDLKEIARNN